MAFSVFNYLSNFYGQTGDALVNRQALSQFANYVLGFANSIVAAPGGSQVSATLLNYADNQIDTVASANDSVQLPFALQGSEVLVINNGAQTMRIYANISPNPNNNNVLDQIVANATTAKTANATPITLASGYTLLFNCSTAGVWKQVSAAS